MMQDHYARRKAPAGVRLVTELESLVYDACPRDQLLSREALAGLVLDRLEGPVAHDVPHPHGRREVLAAIDALEERGFLQCVPGVAVLRFLKGLPGPVAA